MPDSEEPKSSDSKALIKRARECYKKATEADKENRDCAIANIKFARLPGNQWDDQTKTDRGKDRLMLEFNKTKVQCKRVINEMRANRPQEKVRGYEDNDKDTAEIYEGLIRNIHNVSDTDSIADYQAEYQVYGGYGVFELATDYSSDTAFEQDLLVRNIANPFCVWADPAAMDMLKKDAMWWIKTSKIKKATYKGNWPNKDVQDFSDTEFDDKEEWEDTHSVRICEFWWKEPATKEIALLQDGQSVDISKDNPDPVTILKTRTIKCHKVMMAILSGEAVLEPPTEFVIDEFPFVPVYGDYIVIEGKVYWSGMVTDLKDAQRAYNAHRTNIVEQIESAAKAVDWVTAAQAEGHLPAWAEAHKKNFSWRLYNPDPQAPGPPIRTPGAEVPVAAIQASQMASEEMNSLAGFVFDPSAMDTKNVSGKALNARARQGQIATFNYPDNMGKARKRIGELLIKAIPKVYDTERSIRILGADGAEKFVKINTMGDDGQPLNDLSRGKFDLTVTVGPSFATQRQEAVEAYTDVAQTNPQLWGVAGDLMFKAMDLPLADQMAERFKFILPPQIQKQLSDGKDMPPEVQQAMMQVDQAMQQVQEHGQLVQAAQQELEQTKSANEKDKADIQTALANIKVEEAKLGTMKAQFETLVAKSVAQLQSLVDRIDMSEKTQQESSEARSDIADSLQASVDQINAETQEFLTQAASFLQGISSGVQQHMQANPPQVIVAPNPRVVRIERQNGAMIPIYENTTQ